MEWSKRRAGLQLPRTTDFHFQIYFLIDGRFFGRAPIPLLFGVIERAEKDQAIRSNLFVIR